MKKSLRKCCSSQERPASDTYKDEDIPEKVIIKDLADKYEPVELPHRKIIKTLLNNIKDNKLASLFPCGKRYGLPELSS